MAAKTGPRRGRRQQRLASRFYQLKTATASPDNVSRDDQSPGREVLVVPIQHPDHENTCSRTALIGDASRKAAVLEETRKLPGPTWGRDRTKIAELLADERCS